MALTATRFEYRISLSHVDRGREADLVAIAARHPSETHTHLTLRVLARCLLDEDRLEFGPGLSDGDGADLWTHDLTGLVTTWIECGSAAADKIRKVVLHQRGVRAHAVFDDADKAATLVTELEAGGRLGRAAHPPQVWTLDADLVAALARNEARRQKWTVTVVGDHLYIDADGESVDGAASSVLVRDPGKSAP